MANKQLVLLHPSNQMPLVAHLVLAEANEKEKKANVKLQAVGAKNCPVAMLKVNPSVGDTIYGESGITTFLAKTYQLTHLSGIDPFEEVEIQQWLSYISHLSFSPLFSAREKDLKNIENHLSFRSFFVGYHLSLADMFVWSFVVGNETVFDAVLGTDSFPHLKRLVQFCSTLPHFVEVEKKRQELIQKNQPKSRGNAFLQLKGNPQKGKVITRFPPEPSGYMHIGHCKAATLNNFYAKSNEGKLIIRMDDTNPNAEKAEFSQAILSDLKSLGIQGDIFSHTSDYFDLIIDHCEKLLKDGVFFVDGSTSDEIKRLRDAREPSPFRDQTPAENLRLWKLMKDGDSQGTKYVVRAKIDYKSNNGCLRDPNVFRCVQGTPHPRTGYKYKVYPLYDFACPIVDSVEGVTHALRSSEYHDRNPLYNWVIDACKLKHTPIIEDFSRLNFSYMILSKRKLNWFVQNGFVEGWNDPSFPTIQGVLRRGLTVEALRDFILQQGSSKNLNMMDMGKLWALNKQIIDPIVPRYTALIQPVPVTLTNFSGSETRTRALHKKNPSLGKKVAPYSGNILLDHVDADSLSVGEEVTLMDWGNAIIESLEKDGDKVKGVTARLHLEGDFKTTKKKLTWLADVGSDLLEVELVDCRPLLTKPKLEKEDNFEDFVTNPLKIRTAAVGEPALRLLKKGEKIQLERTGYFICDQSYADFQPNATPKLILILIPDGKQQK
mmetsp:Transcript_41/g.81  ORF Transcript_41/g.81 Transcript_41/m.81 type:complete len:718 (-) Transcript_41:62-2215(-)|eukprot:CAMPEP_0201484934 /NCGR_PEP_ID=MMETSP0151_2-20130828/9085_1 /ASSEMBLY_ACC=CAM_ASM_000257 /TAXON_ID=200890 /ORGANISM="Paramoeba atlantica, Strain 621/1 / CCAP 1560/9" /LENGTH=717 /DNA_ID=CAMNT_0047868843 /DNA_START=68 /DNA_END=2221 /DNA_ORIENTATION=-